MARIEKKIWPNWFEKDRDAEGLIDYRLADFDLNEGDTVVFREWDPKSRDYTGRQFERKAAVVQKVESPLRYWSEEDLEKYGLYAIVLEG